MNRADRLDQVCALIKALGPTGEERHQISRVLYFADGTKPSPDALAKFVAVGSADPSWCDGYANGYTDAGGGPHNPEPTLLPEQPSAVVWKTLRGVLARLDAIALDADSAAEGCAAVVDYMDELRLLVAAGEGE